MSTNTQNTWVVCQIKILVIRMLRRKKLLIGPNTCIVS